MAADWDVREIGDGNVNFVFAVRGPSSAVCVKQAALYVRAIGPDWPLTPDRVLFEHEAIVEHRRHAGPYVPEDFTSIADPRRRAAAERRALHLARDLVTAHHRYRTAGDLTEAARENPTAPWPGRWPGCRPRGPRGPDRDGTTGDECQVRSSGTR